MLLQYITGGFSMCKISWNVVGGLQLLAENLMLQEGLRPCRVCQRSPRDLDEVRSLVERSSIVGMLKTPQKKGIVGMHLDICSR